MDKYSTTSFGVNIGTGLMLESILDNTNDRIDDTRIIPNKVDLKKYKVYYISLPSLISNVISSYDKDSTELIIKSNKDMLDIVLDRIISEIVVLKSLLDIDLVFYNMLYTPYHRKNLMKLPAVDTKSYKLKKVIDYLTRQILSSKEVTNAIELDIFLPSRNKALISTSISIDLLNSSRQELDLLEFHTGVLKQRNKFYTKINSGVELPYEELLLFALGDKKGLVNPILSIKERKLLIDAITEKKLKPYNKYSRTFLLSIIKEKELVSKLNEIPNLF